MNDYMKNAMSNLNRIDAYKVPQIDHRSRAERQDDLKKRLGSIDAESLDKLRKKLPQDIFTKNGEMKRWELRDDTDDALHKFQKYIKEFEDLNSEESRKVLLKEEELKVVAKYDWKEKSRLFLFRIMASVLFVATIFTIGYLEHNYEWAKLPLTKYMKPVPKIP